MVEVMRKPLSVIAITSLLGCTSSQPSGGYVLMVAVDAAGSIAYQVKERGFPSQQACERRMNAIASTQDIVLTCVAASEPL